VVFPTIQAVVPGEDPAKGSSSAVLQQVDPRLGFNCDDDAGLRMNGLQLQVNVWVEATPIPHTQIRHIAPCRALSDRQACARPLQSFCFKP
jgi:hypothetical protein